MKRSIESFLFDLDGTLIDSKHDLAFSVQHLQKRFDHPPNTEEEIGRFVGDGVTKLIERALPKLKAADRTEAVRAFKRYYHRHCLDKTRPYPGVREVIEHFRRKKLAVVTNKPVRISRHILDGLGLLNHFQLVVGGDSLREKKPHPAPLQYAMGSMNGTPRSTVMVGDGVNDILAGRAAGTWTCGIISAIGQPEKLRLGRPDFLIERFFELLGIFR